MNPARLRAYFLLLIVSIIWGLAGPVIKLTLGEIPTLPFLVYRFGISSVFALIYGVIAGFKHVPKNPKILLFVLVYAFLNTTVALGLLFLGLEKTTVLDMSLISLFGPLMISIAGVILLNERITNREKIGILIAFLGTAFTVLEPIITKGDGLTRLSGNVLILANLVVNTAVVVMAKKLLRDEVNPVFLTNIGFVVGFITITPLAIVSFGGASTLNAILNLSLKGHAGVIFMALVSGTLAYALWSMAQKTIEISEASLFAYLYPIFSAPLAIIWLGEKVTPVFLLGAIIIAIGVLIAEYKKRRYRNLHNH